MYSKKRTAGLFEESEVFQEEVKMLGAGRRAGRGARKEAAWWGGRRGRGGQQRGQKEGDATHGPSPSGTVYEVFLGILFPDLRTMPRWLLIGSFSSDEKDSP